MAYTPPEGNITSSVDFFNWINLSISNWFFPGIVLAVYFIILIKLMGSVRSSAESFASASFICMILSILLRVADMVNNAFMVIFIILTSVGVVWMHFENSRHG